MGAPPMAFHEAMEYNRTQILYPNLLMVACFAVLLSGGDTTSHDHTIDALLTPSKGPFAARDDTTGEGELQLMQLHHDVRHQEGRNVRREHDDEQRRDKDRGQEALAEAEEMDEEAEEVHPALKRHEKHKDDKGDMNPFDFIEAASDDDHGDVRKKSKPPLRQVEHDETKALKRLSHVTDTVPVTSSAPNHAGSRIAALKIAAAKKRRAAKAAMGDPELQGGDKYFIVLRKGGTVTRSTAAAAADEEWLPKDPKAKPNGILLDAHMGSRTEVTSRASRVASTVTSRVKFRGTSSNYLKNKAGLKKNSRGKVR